MASAPRAVPRRYIVAKLQQATEEFLYHLFAFRKGADASGSAAPGAEAHGSALSYAVSKFREAYSQPSTKVILMAGAAMAPALNRRALTDRNALESLVLRVIPRPSSSSVLVGDVVAFESPVSHPSSASHVIVRRVAASEGDELEDVSDSDSTETLQVPPNHFWALADNPDLRPPDVIDSRAFGFVPYANITGRVIYKAHSATDHGPVRNSSVSEMSDQPFIEAEVDIDEMFPPESDEGDDAYETEQDAEEEQQGEGEQAGKGGGAQQQRGETEDGGGGDGGGGGKGKDGQSPPPKR